MIIGPAYPLRGGIADTNESLCRALNKAGHDCEIVSYKLQYPNILFPGKTQYSAEEPPADLKINAYINSVNPLNWVSVPSKIKIMKPDLVIVRYWIPFIGISLGSICKRLSKFTTVIALVDNLIPHEKRAGDIFITKRFIRQCHAFISMSGTVENDIKKFTDKPVLTMHHPINDNLGGLITKEEACAKLGLDASKNYLLFFGLVRHYKGLDLLIKSLTSDLLKDINLELLVAGEFYDDPEQYYKLIEENGLKEKVRLRNEFIPSAEVPWYFCAADLVTQTYRTATQSGITQMAYHFNKPMVVTNVGGLPEMVPDGKVGYVVPGEPENIASAISRFFSENKANEFIANIKEEKKRFSWQTFAENLVLYYQKEARKTEV